MRIPDPKANTTTEAYLAYKAGYLEESELKPVLYEPYLHFDAWLAYWAGLTTDYPHEIGKNLASGTQKYSDNAYRIYFADQKTMPKTFTVSFTCPAVGSSSVGIIVYYNASVNTGVLRSVNLSEGDKISFTITLSNEQWDKLRNGEGGFIQMYRTGAWTTSPSSLDDAQIEEGSTATPYEPYTKNPEMLCDEEALVAYLSGVTDTYPEDIKDPYDVRIVGYLKYLVSARWGRPEYPVNNEEFYLSTMKPPVVPSGDTPSSDIEMDDTAEAPFIDLKMYGDTSQQAYSGFQLLQKQGLATPTTDTNFWYSVTNQTITALEDGWARFTSSSSSASKNFSFNRLGAFSWEVSTTYTVICEIKNAPSAGRVVLAQPQNESDPFASVSVGGQADYAFDGTDHTLVFSGTTKSSLVSMGLRPFFNSSFASESSVDLRLTIVAGDHTSDYQNYIGDNWEPYTGVIPAPNPDYPQPVNVVTGRQVVEVSGKNMLDALNGYVDGYINASGGVSYGGGTNALFDYIEVKPEIAYTLSQKSDSLRLRNYGFAYYDASKTFLSRDTYSLQTAQAITTPSNCRFVRIWVANSQTGVSQEIIEDAQLQFEQGSTATTYKPYQSQSYEINLGKNLINGVYSEIRQTARCTAEASGNGFKITSTTSSGATYVMIPIPNIAKLLGKTVTVSYVATGSGVRARFFYYSSSWAATDSVGNSETVTLPNSIEGYAGIGVVFYTSNGSSATYTDIQLEEGLTATSYAPYFEPIELCKIGDYQDYIYRDEDGDWYIHRNVQHLSLPVSSMDSDSENYPGWTIPSVTDILKNTLPDGNYPLVENTSLLCNCLGSGGDMINKVRWNNNISVPKLYLSKTSSEYYQLSYSEWIEQYPNLVLELYYGIVKNAPRTIITNPELISQLNALMEGGSYEGKTYIKVTATDPNLPGLLYVEAGKYD